MSKCSANAVYGLGFIGALIYNMQYAVGISAVLWGLVKTAFWPAFLVYKILSVLGI